MVRLIFFSWCCLILIPAKNHRLNFSLPFHLGSGTPPCGRTPVDDAPPQMYDMLGEPIVPQEQRVATPPIHGVNIVGTMNSAPVADLISTQNSKPATVSITLLYVLLQNFKARAV